MKKLIDKFLARFGYFPYPKDAYWFPKKLYKAKLLHLKQILRVNSDESSNLYIEKEKEHFKQIFLQEVWESVKITERPWSHNCIMQELKLWMIKSHVYNEEEDEE